ncbi:MAG TPA: LysR family transcriptional regulator [Steroidobacteraceae bacterium]|jgi:DNA-binding transcriptional LysR family regulator|nr:LysR family transcriptional regulator [Steroidobacteraceae bacterium]
MDTLTGIKVFLEVVGSGSFVAAAERLDVSTATVSKHVMHLEERLGIRLLNRNSRSLSTTEPGRLYFERCRVILDDLEETELELGSLGTTPRGTLRVTCPSWFASQRMAKVLEQYRARFPQIVVDVSFEDRLVDLVEDGYDLALRVTAGLESLPAGLIARPARALPFLVAASRDYLRRIGAPGSPEDLAKHDCIAVGRMHAWVFDGPNGRTEVPARIVQRIRSTAAVPHAVAAGVGLAPLPLTIFEEPAFRDVLLPVLPEHPLRQTTLYLVYVSRKYVPLKIRSFIDFVVEFVAAAAAHEPAGA